MHQPPEIILFVGRLHPLLVHLPIGMLCLLAALELAAWMPRFQKANASAGYIIALAAPLAVVTAGCGWLLSLSGGYDPSLLAWHKWLGTITAIGAVATALLYRWRKFNSYRVSLFVTAAILAATGHLGGSLTHGSDYLSRYAPGPLKWMLGGSPQVLPGKVQSTKNIKQSPVFAGIVLPIFQNKCINCHGPAKSKGGLRLDSYSAVMQGGDDGLAVKPVDLADSPLWQRIQLPVDADDHMPPGGKPQLTAAEAAAIKWWIETGTRDTNTVAELKPSPNISQVLSELEGQAAKAN